MSLDHLYSPPTGSREKFRARLNEEIRIEKQETLTIKVLTGAMAAAIAIIAFAPSWNTNSSLKDVAAFFGNEPRKTTTLSVASVQAQESTPGVRMYWVVR